MALVDPEDDEIERWVVRVYAYDPARHERRHQVIAAFDNEAEFLALVEDRGARLKQHRLAGEQIDPRERLSGVHLEPGYRRRQQNERLIRRAIERGVSGVSVVSLVEDSELPPEAGITWARLSPGSGQT